jgi:hypothetical protein
VVLALRRATLLFANAAEILLDDDASRTFEIVVVSGRGSWT